jgi:hypothetical protein
VAANNPATLKMFVQLLSNGWVLIAACQSLDRQLHRSRRITSKRLLKFANNRVTKTSQDVIWS